MNKPKFIQKITLKAKHLIASTRSTKLKLFEQKIQNSTDPRTWKFHESNL